jgi:uncharacterized phage-associated protein
MIPYRKEKIDNAVCFFALKHKKLSGKFLTQTYLYKYLALLDFYNIEMTGMPTFDFEYRAMERGPVPTEIYNKRDFLKTELYEFKKQDENVYIIEPKGEPNLDYFSKLEIVRMIDLVRTYAKKYSTTNEITEASHQQIRAWQKTYKLKENEIIDYGLTFEGDLRSKKEQDLTSAEECYLTYMALKSASKCKSAR